MFSIFGKGQSKETKPPAAIATNKQNPSEKSRLLREEAMRNARAAREAIGEENLQKLVSMLQKKEQDSPMLQARKILEKLDRDKVADNLVAMIKEREKPH